MPRAIEAALRRRRQPNGGRDVRPNAARCRPRRRTEERAPAAISSRSAGGVKRALDWQRRSRRRDGAGEATRARPNATGGPPSAPTHGRRSSRHCRTRPGCRRWQVLNDVLGAVTDREPPMRDIDGVRRRSPGAPRIPNMHALTTPHQSGGDRGNGLPPPEQPFLAS